MKPRIRVWVLEYYNELNKYKTVQRVNLWYVKPKGRPFILI